MTLTKPAERLDMPGRELQRKRPVGIMKARPQQQQQQEQVDEYAEPHPKRKRRELIAIDASGGSDLEDEEPSEADMSGSDLSDAETQLLQGRKALLARGSRIHKGKPESFDGHGSSTVNQFGRKQDLKNRQRVLALSSRGITHRHRHLLNDLVLLMPQAKKDSKVDSKSQLGILNELCELNHCNNCLYLEARKHQDLYMWLSKTPNGPSAKFLIQNIHTMDELQMTGNCLKGSRPILSFDTGFDTQPHLQLLKELFVQIFGTPSTSRKVKPFIDRVMSFSFTDKRIWVRNYQIVESTDNSKGKEVEMSLVEIGPRFVMNPIRIFNDSFGGATLYENPTFVTPNEARRQQRLAKQAAYVGRVQSNAHMAEKAKASQLDPDPLDNIFS